jgi:predicted TIM-barrel fold metal-dependent hydrolase
MPDSDTVSSVRDIDVNSAEATAEIPDFIISADSHITEPQDLFDGLPAGVRERVKLFIGQKQRPDGAMNPEARIIDMDRDGLDAEVLYPDMCLGMFSSDADVQEAAFPIYNDWIADFAKTSPKRLYGVMCLPAYDIDFAIKELQRGADLGLKAAMLWEVPDPKYPFTGNHYEKLWSAAEEAGMPINLHILTGYNWFKEQVAGIEHMRRSGVMQVHATKNTLFDFIWSGVLERHPKLKVVMVESEIGWVPFSIQHWDYQFDRVMKTKRTQIDLKRPPSEYFFNQVYCTYMDDYMGSRMIADFGENNFMWSSDYGHPSMTWPNSRAFISRQLGYLPLAKQERVLSKNVVELYNLDV